MPNSATDSLKRVVVVIDICSSTSLLEDLLHSENQKRWRNLLIRLKKHLTHTSAEYDFDIYKFLGDGWVLIFDDTITGTKIMKFLSELAYEYEWQFHNGVCEVLAGRNHRIGITAGVDVGTIVPVTMNGRLEYVGRPINMACRLQSAVSHSDKRPENKLLMSKSAHVHLGLSRSKKYEGQLVERQLRNVMGGQPYQAKKIKFH